MQVLLRKSITTLGVVCDGIEKFSKTQILYFIIFIKKLFMKVSTSDSVRYKIRALLKVGRHYDEIIWSVGMNSKKSFESFYILLFLLKNFLKVSTSDLVRYKIRAFLKVAGNYEEITDHG